MIIILWLVVVYLFSNQTGAESTRVSKKVTKEILRIKDKLVVVIDNYEDTGEIVIRRNTDKPNNA